MIRPGAFSDGWPVGLSVAFAQSWRLALTSSPLARNAAPIAAKPARHELVPASDSTTTGGPRAAPSAHDACSHPMYLMPRVKEIWPFTPAGSPSVRKLRSGMLLLIHGSARERRWMSLARIRGLSFILFMDPYARMKEATKWMWGLGDYREVATHLEPHAQALAHRADVRPGMEVLDVAAGNGNFAIAAAERGVRVTEAAAPGYQWREADAEALPFANDRFDVVASVFGAMFAPRPERVAAELFRVARPDGVVAMANYG